MFREREISPCRCALEPDRGTRAVGLRPTPYAVEIPSLAGETLTDPRLPCGSVHEEAELPTSGGGLLRGHGACPFTRPAIGSHCTVSPRPLLEARVGDLGIGQTAKAGQHITRNLRDGSVFI